VHRPAPGRRVASPSSRCARGGALLVLGLLAAGLLAAVPAGAQGQYFGQNKVRYRTYDWRYITSDHYEVYYYSGLDSLALRVLDLAEKTNLRLSALFGHELVKRVPIILYGSHNDFAQTNVTPELIDQGTGGFTEVLRNRVVLPFTGSYEDLRHVVVHELVHAHMFDMLYGGAAGSLIARQTFFQIPLWFAEGLAEYVSLGMEPNAAMFLRDGVIAGYMIPLQYAGGYLVYKEGQSSLSYLAQRFGEDRVRDILQKTRMMHSFDRGFERSVGMPIQKFDEQWHEWLKKQYWPTVAQKDDPEQFARRLTDHRHDESVLNTSPSVSPDGDLIAFFSDRRQYTDVYLMSALDGRVIRRIIRGQRSYLFEDIPSFRSAIAWSGDGKHLALVAQSRGRDVLYVVEAKTGRVTRRVRLAVDAMSYPAWSPVADSIVVVGVKDGRSDLYLISGDGKITRLTNDTWDEKDPVWSPDGKLIAFSSDRPAPVVLQAEALRPGSGGYSLQVMDVASHAISPLADTAGDDSSPAWSPDGRRVAFVSDRDGAPNIYLLDRADSSFTQLTDVIGGVTCLTWSRRNDRLVFSAFNRGGWDVFAVREPLSLDAVLARLRRSMPQSVLNWDQARRGAPPPAGASPTLGALAVAWPDSVTTRPDTLAGAPRLAEPPLEVGGRVDTLRADAGRPHEPPAWSAGRPNPFVAPEDTLRPLPTRAPLVERGGPFALSDSLLAQRPQDYHVHLSPDFASAGVLYASGFGLVGSSQLYLSDFLGNHNLLIATDLFSSSLEETNALVLYGYLPKRWDLSFGAFHFKNYYSSRVTTLGEEFSSPRLFSDRLYGALVQAAYPFDRFHRAEVGFTQMFVDRRFFVEDVFGDIIEQGGERRSVTSPSVSLVGDNSLFGYYGPINGRRYNITYAPSLGWFPNALRYQTVTFDTRYYWDLTHQYTFATRLLAGGSFGDNAQFFRVGGFSTLRGYPDFDVLGTRVALVNTELRFPFVQQLGVLGPLPIGGFNLRGAVFTDAGLVWDEHEPLRLTRVQHGALQLEDLRMGFGAGVRTLAYFMVLKLDVGWRTDLVDTSRPRWYFSIGPEF
jgi:Tol biopolymer transport system component